MSPPFMVEGNGSCLIPFWISEKNRLQVFTTFCNRTDPTQRWLWTTHNQLMNFERSVCLTQGVTSTSGLNYPILVECDSSDNKQKWKCMGDQFLQSDTNNYMMSIGSHSVAFTYRKMLSYNSRWRRLESKEHICFVQGKIEYKT